MSTTSATGTAELRSFFRAEARLQALEQQRRAGVPAVKNPAQVRAVK
jgi:hypothetical protein